jgi:hypothetical protein
MRVSVRKRHGGRDSERVRPQKQEWAREGRKENHTRSKGGKEERGQRESEMRAPKVPIIKQSWCTHIHSVIGGRLGF